MENNSEANTDREKIKINQALWCLYKQYKNSVAQGTY